MDLLITGASGLIGTRFLERYSSQFNKIYVLGRSPVDNYEFIEFEMTTVNCPELPNVDCVLHLAAQTSANLNGDQITEDAKINILSFLSILQRAGKMPHQPFVINAGTATQIGLTTDMRSYDETEPDRPQTFYDISKNAAETYLKQFVREGLIGGCSLRLANVFGGAIGGSHKSDRSIIDRTMTAALAGEDLTIYGTGNYQRDYIYVDDVTDAFFAACKNRDNLNSEHLLIGTGTGTLLKDAFGLISSLALEFKGMKTNLQFVDMPPNSNQMNERNFVPDVSRARDLMGWQALHDLESGLRKTYRP